MDAIVRTEEHLVLQKKLEINEPEPERSKLTAVHTKSRLRRRRPANEEKGTFRCGDVWLWLTANDTGCPASGEEPLRNSQRLCAQTSCFFFYVIARVCGIR